MSLKVGDTFFNRIGQPGLVIGRDQLSSKVKVEQEGQRSERARTYGYINGLTTEDRGEFEAIIDEVRTSKDPEKRVSVLQDRIEDMQKDPKKQVLARYLEGELAHVMNSEGVRPKVYTAQTD